MSEEIDNDENQDQTSDEEAYQNQIETQIAHSLSVHSLVQQVASAQKSMRRSAALLITFCFVCAILYLPVPGIAGVELNSLFGTTIVADSQALRFVSSVVLLYYIIIFGTNYYKGLHLIEEADKNINESSTGLSDDSKRNYNVSLSDNYLFDAMRRVTGKRYESDSEELADDTDKNSQKKPTDSVKMGNVALYVYQRFDSLVRDAVALGVIFVFILFVLFGEYLVMVGLTGMGTQLDSAGSVELTTFGGITKYVTAFVFAILSYLFFSYLSKLFGERKKNVRKQLFIIIAALMAIVQISIFPNIAEGDEDLKSLHYGCRLTESVIFDESKKARCD